MRTPIPERLAPGVTLYHGDAMDVLAGMASGSVSATITDPPYSERTHKGHDATASGHAGGGHDGAARKCLGYGRGRKTM